MSAEMQVPVLVPGEVVSEIRFEHRTGYLQYPVELYDPLLAKERKRFKHGWDGILTAAGLLLTEAAVAIYHVNTDVRTASRHTDGWAYSIGNLLGFNDHGGGTESAFKILVNDFGPTDPKQYVLLSPPCENEQPTNTTFRNCSFESPSLSARTMQYRDGMPNALKTGDITHKYNRRDYRFCLFGGSHVPRDFIKTFRHIGFTFENNPYRFEESWPEIDQEDRHSWPGDQFAGQVALLGASAGFVGSAQDQLRKLLPHKSHEKSDTIS